VPVGVSETDGAATGTVDEPVGLGEAEEVGLGVAVVLGVEVVVVVGEADGEGVEVAVADGEVDGVVDGVAGAADVVGLPWAGATRFGV